MSYAFIEPMNSSILSLRIHQTNEFIHLVHFIMRIQLIIIFCYMNSFVMSSLFSVDDDANNGMALTKAKTMKKIGHKKSKCNDSVYKEKLKKKKLEKKLEDKDSDYEPNLFEAKDSDYEVDVSNRKPPPETIVVQENNRVFHASNTVTDGMENIPTPHKSVAVANFNTNDHHKNFVSLSTISFILINYFPKIGGIG